MPNERTIDALEDGLADDIPPYLRKPEEGTVQAGQFWLSCINAKLQQLEALRLRSHVTLLESKAAMERWARGEGFGELFPVAMKRQGWFFGLIVWHQPDRQLHSKAGPQGYGGRHQSPRERG